MDEYEKISYDDLRDENENKYDSLEKNPWIADEHTVKDLVILFQLEEISNQIDNGADKADELDDLFAQLHYEYDEEWCRIDPEAERVRDEEREHMRPRRENAWWKKEKTLITDDDKIALFHDIIDHGHIVDKMVFVDEGMIIHGLWIEIRWLDKNDLNKKEDVLRVFSSYYIPVWWYDEEDCDDEDMSENVDYATVMHIHHVKEIIVNNVKYTFLV